ncbi:MAG: hypothetical protein ACSHWP_00195 [Pseudoalteromonas sp.]
MSACNQDNTKEREYSPFLRITKPFIDTTKRANLRDKLKEDKSFQIVSNALTMIPEQTCSQTQSVELMRTLKNQQNRIEDSYRMTNLQKLKVMQGNCEQLVDAVDQYLKMSISKVQAISGRTWLAEEQGSRGIVVVSDEIAFENGWDNTWDEIALSAVQEQYKDYKCDAIVYITLGYTDKKLRRVEKASDVFVLSSFDTLQLMEEVIEANSLVNGSLEIGLKKKLCKFVTDFFNTKEAA